jgi:hypothetical protein
MAHDRRPLDATTGDKPRRKIRSIIRPLTLLDYLAWAAGLTVSLTIANVLGGVSGTWIYIIGSAVIWGLMKDDAGGESYVGIVLTLQGISHLSGRSWSITLVWFLACIGVFQCYNWAVHEKMDRFATLLRVSISCIGWLVLADVLTALK